ncbi:MAG: hypothetical protein FD174_2459 [Geobacteraceae bacterium]|nr:MAG: hypothetical protein FD174_2459 [Geobacteraceae bacterium]
MEKPHLYRLIVCILTVLIVAGCGGGGGTQGVATQPTTAVLKLYTQNVSSPLVSQSITGVTLKINLPGGVTVKTDAGGAVSPGVIVVAGVAVGKASTFAQIYTSATATAPATLSFAVVSTDAGGFEAGEFVTVNCDITPGAFPKNADFTLSDETVSLLNSPPLDTMKITLTSEIK